MITADSVRQNNGKKKCLLSKLHECNSIHEQMTLMSHFCLVNQKPTEQTVKSDSQSNDSDYNLVLLMNW